ncbi:hypothetical protein JHK82_034954 [Glycine max]|nr:hypothetical protein JHK82_034954 [Glycine max]
MERYATISIRIRDLNPGVTLPSKIMTLKLGSFTNSLCRKQPKYLNELRAKAAGYIQMEELFAFRNQVNTKHSSRRPIPPPTTNVKSEPWPFQTSERSNPNLYFFK